MTLELVKTNAARRAIAEAKSVDEVKGIRDKAEAVRMYAKQARLGIEMQNDAAEIKLRAERRAGEMLAVMEKNGGGRPAENRSRAVTGLSPKLEDLGVTKNQSSQWQQMASVPEDRLEQYMAYSREAEQEITTAGALRAGGSDYKRDAKSNRPGNLYEPVGYDACQTPGYALDPLLPDVPPTWTIWEPACGEGLLVDAFYDAGYSEQAVIGTDILAGHNFFEYEPAGWDCIITNPPFSIKYDWLKRCYALGKPFALLLPVETLGAKTAQELFAAHGLEVMFLDKRVNFKMPNKGWDGAGAQFPVAWFTWQFNLGAQMVFASLSHAPD